MNRQASSTVTITPREAATLLRISPSTLAHWRVRGFGPLYLKYGSRRQAVIRYRLADIEDWMQQQQEQCQGRAWGPVLRNAKKNGG
ncbi:MAG: helix-turn-helix transcriptional regulator [Kiritimatiellia bacterium]